MVVKRLVLINGSSRKKGTSYSFSRTIGMLAEASGNAAEIIHAIDCFDGKEDFESLKELIIKSDIIAVISPLYADTLPYHDIWLLEKLADEYQDALKGKDFFAVGQCGFPDITRIEPLLDSCRLFAEETEMRWLGGLAFGGGPLINGAFLEELGKKGEKIDTDSQKLIMFNIPKLLYRPMAAYLNNNARKQARQNGNIDFARKVYFE